jgi:crotonobetainyl-CoA:carnitine CoA-transferase CaiB-like acyl-CoA transferase
MVGVSILTALLARELHGVGQEVNISSLGSLIQLASLNISFQHWVEDFERLWTRPERSEMANPLFNYYRCGDEKWICLALLTSDRYWPDFCRAMGIESLEKDPKFDTWESRAENCQELIAIIDRVFATKSRDEWMSIFDENPDFIYAPVQTLADLATDPQIVENGYIVDYEHPVLGSIKHVGVPVELAGTPGAIRLPAPELGQHTEEVLRDIAGYTWDDIAQLKDEEVI